MSLLKKSAIALAVASTLGFSVISSAAAYVAPCNGWWTARLLGGVNFPVDNSFTVSSTRGVIDWKTGGAVEGNVGYLGSDGFGYGIGAGYFNGVVKTHNAVVISNPELEYRTAFYGVYGSYAANAWGAWGLIPEVAVKAGVSHIDVRGAGDSVSPSRDIPAGDSTRMYGAVLAGFNWQFSDDWSAGVHYQYWSTFSALKNTDKRFASHQLLASLSWRTKAC